MIFASNLKIYRTISKLTQKELGARLGVSAGIICMLERGQLIPRLDMTEQIAKFFGVTISELVETAKR